MTSFPNRIGSEDERALAERLSELEERLYRTSSDVPMWELPPGGEDRIEAWIDHAVAGLTDEGKATFEEAAAHVDHGSSPLHIADAIDVFCQPEYQRSGMYGRIKEQQQLVEERVADGTWPFAVPDKHSSHAEHDEQEH